MSPPRPRRSPARLLLATSAALVVAAGGGRVSAAPPSGEQLYKAQCASCHGPAGEGVKGKYDHPLAGDRSVGQLSKLIANTMPEDNPGSCVGTDADAVATFVHAAFYSPAARERNRPARIELARLTVAQYRHAVADVVGTFRAPSPAKWDGGGLKGEYFNNRNHRNDRRVLDRTDPEVKFDWKTDSPLAGKIEPHEFAVRWTGSVLAPETGEYEFAVRTDHAVRVWVNDMKAPVVDAYVKSGKDDTHTGTVFLLAGRVYPIKLDFSKAKQGVQDKKAAEKPPAPASVALLWKPPGGGRDVIPARNLSPKWAPEGFALATPFPPDDRSLGWERGTTVSKAWDAATTDAALEVAGYVAARLPELANAKDGSKDRDAKLKDFARRFVERAFRRPLDAEQVALYVTRPFERAKDPDAAVKRVVLLALKSPRFLYREAGGGPDTASYDTAARLAFALWDSLPDDELRRAAAAGKLASPDLVRKQAERMLQDPRAKAKLRGFLHQWLKADPAPDLTKDSHRFPGFDPAVVADLRTSLDLTLDDALWAGDGDFRKLLLGDELFLNGRLSKVYGADLPADAGFTKVKFEPGKRAGVLTHPYLLSAFAYTATSSPIHRGVFLARGVLGIGLKPPPEAFSPLAPDLHPTLTTRARVALQTKPAACQTCHNVVNPLGFALENFDAIGRWRDADNAKTVDAAGSYVTRAGQTATFTGPRPMAAFLAGSPEVHAAFVEQLFHHLAQQPVRAYGPTKLDDLRAGFAAGGYDVRKLAVAVATTTALTGRPVPGERRVSTRPPSPGQDAP